MLDCHHNLPFIPSSRRPATAPIAPRARRISIGPVVYPRRRAMQIAKWGNSLAVRLPASVVEALEPKAGDDIEIHVADHRSFSIAPKPGREELLRRLRSFRGRLPADFKFDREEANAR